MKDDLQPRVLYPERVLFKIEGKIRAPRQEKAERFCYYQTSITRTLKSLFEKKNKEKKKK